MFFVYHGPADVTTSYEAHDIKCTHIYVYVNMCIELCITEGGVKRVETFLGPFFIFFFGFFFFFFFFRFGGGG